jgi:hypothetical protein
MIMLGEGLSRATTTWQQDRALCAAFANSETRSREARADGADELAKLLLLIFSAHASSFENRNPLFRPKKSNR